VGGCEGKTSKKRAEKKGGKKTNAKTPNVEKKRRKQKTARVLPSLGGKHTPRTWSHRSQLEKTKGETKPVVFVKESEELFYGINRC